MCLSSRSFIIPVLSYRNLIIVGLLIVAAAIGCAMLTRKAKAATTWQVSVGNPGACTTGDPNCASIGAAVSASSSGDTINVAAGTYNENNISIDSDLTISGAGASTTIVDAQQLGRVFDICCGTVNISGLTIKGGQTSPGSVGVPSGSNGTPGGGIRNQGTLNITSCTISNNVTGKGGDIGGVDTPVDSNGPPALVTAGTGGQGGAGGGIYNFNGGNLTIRNSTVSNNQTGNGGNGNGSGGGGTGGDGGGIWNNSTLTVINSTIASNQTGAGGTSTPPTGPSVSGKGTAFAAFSCGAGGEGGGIANSGTLTVQASTIALNQTGSNGCGNGGAGGGVYSGATVAGTFKSDIIASNSVGAGGLGPDVFTDTPVSSQGYNLVGKTDGSSGFTAGTDQTGTIATPLDAKLDPAGLQSNGGPTKTIALQATSPAVDRGINSFALTTDQRGASFARTFDNPSVSNATAGDGTDVGAFEIQAPPSPCAPDTTPPTITCPANVTKFTDSGQNTATVNPGTPVASDNCALKSVTGVRSDGKALNAPYPIGVTLITWTATDMSGNTASCGQSIAVSVPGGSRRILP